LEKIQFSFVLVTRALSRKQIAGYLSVNGSVNDLITYKIKNIFLLSLDFSTDSSRCS